MTQPHFCPIIKRANEIFDEEVRNGLDLEDEESVMLALGDAYSDAFYDCDDQEDYPESDFDDCDGE
jgi:hypothetical protein